MRRFLGGFLAGVAVTCAVLVGIGHTLDVEDPLRPADAIVALSGDNGPRTRTAVDLWDRKVAPFIIFAGASEDPNSVASGELMKREAVALGVPEAAILVEPASTTTQENARLVADLMKTRGLTSAILVTSPYHQRRAANLLAAEFAPASLAFTNYPARDPQWDPNTWFLHDPARTLTAVELVKLSVEIASAIFH
ncbi:MAG: YdcF family protein [Chloroflexota bacterium]|nr:YdcF family protein [Chloroflexota bacterium]